MLKLLKLLKALKAKGFATAEEKANIKTMFKELGEANAEEAEAVKDEVEAGEALPETDPNEGKVDEDIQEGIKSIISSHVKSLEGKTASEMTKKFGELEKNLKDEVQKWVDEQKTLMAKKSGVYNPDVAEKRKGMNTYLRDMTRALLAGDVGEMQKLNGNVSVKELTTDSTGSPYGGYVVDRELSAEIRHLITTYGVARREMMTVALTKNSYDANTLVTDVTVSWVGEGSAIPSTQPVLGQESLVLKKLGAIVTLTRELLEDQEIDLFSFIASRVAEGFARLEDRAFFVGEGSGDTANAEFTGALYATGTGEVVMNSATFSTMDADDLLAMQDESPQSIVETGKYFMHRSIRNVVRKLKDNQGQYIYQAPSENGPATIWGKPVVEVEVMPSLADTDADVPFVIFGDLKKAYMVGYKGAISADRFNAGIVRNVAGNADINLITTDREAIRWVERVGGVPVLPTAITVLKTGDGS